MSEAVCDKDVFVIILIQSVCMHTFCGLLDAKSLLYIDRESGKFNSFYSYTHTHMSRAHSYIHTHAHTHTYTHIHPHRLQPAL